MDPAGRAQLGLDDRTKGDLAWHWERVRGGGSHDDEPERASLPGLRELALTPEQKNALGLLEELYAMRLANKERRKAMKESEQDLLDDVLEALDGLDMKVGKLGHATFEQRTIRKLKLAVAKRKAKDARGAGE